MPASINKRQKERERDERRREKEKKRDERRNRVQPDRGPNGEDPDIAGIVPGPQPLPDEEPV